MARHSTDADAVGPSYVIPAAGVLDGADLAFYERARPASQSWDARTAFAWQQASPLSDERLELAWQLASQSVYGEQLGMSTAAWLLSGADDYGARLSLALAVSDEARHTEAFARYALARGGELEPPARGVAAAERALTEARTFHRRYMVHTLLESIALDEFDLLSHVFRGDLLAAVYTAVARDEARHVAMGMAFLAAELGRDHTGEVADLLDEMEAGGLALAGFDDYSYEWLAELTESTPGATRQALQTRLSRRVRSIRARVDGPSLTAHRRKEVMTVGEEGDQVRQA